MTDDDLRDELAGVMAVAAGEEWPTTGDNAVAKTYHWLGEAEDALPIVTADRERLARKLDQLARHANFEAQRYAPNTPERISQIAKRGAYAWAARLVRGGA